MTPEALKAAVMVLPATRHRVSTLPMVTMAVISVPLASARTTSAFMAPGVSCLTVPVRQDGRVEPDFTIDGSALDIGDIAGVLITRAREHPEAGVSRSAVAPIQQCFNN